LFSSEAMAGQYVRLFEELRQGKYPLPTPRSVLRQQGYSPFSWKDYLPVVARRVWLHAAGKRQDNQHEKKH
jgi:hypothetical protein